MSNDESLLDQRIIKKTKTIIHTQRVTTELRLKEPDDDNIILRLDDPSFDELLETVTFNLLAPEFGI